MNKRTPKQLTRPQLNALVETKLASLRATYKRPTVAMHAQERETLWRLLGQIEILDEVQMLLRGHRRSFI